ncbi:MAG: hypothetical protein ACAI25_05690, partial [Planctomycetota bacterium]
MTVERPADSTREPAFVDDAPLVFTDGAGGPPLPDPAEPPPEAWKSLLGRLVRSQKKFVKPSLVSQRPVEERPCAKCTKPVRVDLLSCPFCAHRFERLSREPVAMERVDGAVVPATLVREFAEQRDRDTVASRLERERRMGNRVRLTAIGVIMLVVPTIFIWFMIAPSHFLAPAIVAEAISAWIVMRTLLGARGGSMAASIAVTPGAAARLIAGMACAFAMEPSVQRPGELIMGTEGRGAAAVFAMIAGSVVLSYVLATLLGIGIEQAEDDYTAQQPRGPRTFKGALLEVIAGFKGAFMVGAPDVLQPRARAAQPQPIAALGAGIHPGRLAPLEE